MLKLVVEQQQRSWKRQQWDELINLQGLPNLSGEKDRFIFLCASQSHILGGSNPPGNFTL
jgi:hypothetical protein